jgi:hyperosmotically inducible protein
VWFTGIVRSAPAKSLFRLAYAVGMPPAGVRLASSKVLLHVHKSRLTNQEITMKTMSLLKTSAVALTLLVGLGACAGDATHRSTGQYIDDKTISTRVNAALLADKDVKSSQIGVTTYNGVVQLSGFVESPELAQRAVVVAQQVDGVKAVKDDMHFRQ